MDYKLEQMLDGLPKVEHRHYEFTCTTGAMLHIVIVPSNGDSVDGNSDGWTFHYAGPAQESREVYRQHVVASRQWIEQRVEMAHLKELQDAVVEHYGFKKGISS